MIRTKRVYEPPAAQDGARFLVERLWPRGIKKQELDAQAWLREVASSAELRQWFEHDPSKWSEFKRKYYAELNWDRKHGSRFSKSHAAGTSPCSTAPATPHTRTRWR